MWQHWGSCNTRFLQHWITARDEMPLVAVHEEAQCAQCSVRLSNFSGGNAQCFTCFSEVTKMALEGNKLKAGSPADEEHETDPTLNNTERQNHDGVQWSWS